MAADDDVPGRRSRGVRRGREGRGVSRLDERGPYLRPRSFLSVPPYLGRVPIRSMISGMQEAKMAWKEAAGVRERAAGGSATRGRRGDPSLVKAGARKNRP